MHRIKSLDFFRRPQEELQKKTRCGAILSVLTVTIILYLSAHEIVSARQGLSQRIQLAGSRTANQLEVAIDVVFHHAPCSALTIELKDKTQSRLLAPSLTLTRLVGTDNTPLPASYIDPEILQSYPRSFNRTQQILTGLKSHEKCRIQGRFLANRVPGLLRFSHSEHLAALRDIRDQSRELYSRLNLGHKVFTLSFMSPSFPDPAAGFNELPHAGGFLLDRPGSCGYYVRVVPHVFSLGSAEAETFRYSYHRSCFVLQCLRNLAK